MALGLTRIAASRVLMEVLFLAFPGFGRGSWTRGSERKKARGSGALKWRRRESKRAGAVMRPTVNVPVDPPTSRDRDDPAIVRGTTRDDRNVSRPDDCTNCTNGNGGPPEAIDGRGGPRLPEPDPELFLLAGLSAASTWPGGARLLRARAELQAVIAEVGPRPSR
jgi:hypothetical protein